MPVPEEHSSGAAISENLPLMARLLFAFLASALLSVTVSPAVSAQAPDSFDIASMGPRGGPLRIRRIR